MGTSPRADLRQEANARYFIKQQSKRHIIKTLGVSWNFVQAWTRSPDQDCAADARGWQPGRSRRHPKNLRARIIAIRRDLVHDPVEFYFGDLAIQQRYAQRFAHDPLPSRDYIVRILRDAGLTESHHPKRRGTAKYLCYPVAAVRSLGERVAEVDFIGAKFIAGAPQPLHFLSVAYATPERLRCIERTNGETTSEAITVTKRIFNDLGWPDATRVDAGNVFTGRGERGDGKGARSIPRYAAFLLQHRVTPVFGAIRSPWNQAHVEGSNSVFGRNFWNRQDFTSVHDVDDRLTAFNACSKKYAQWKPWSRTTTKQSFVPRICFIRKGEEDARMKHGWIPVASERVTLPKELIGLFVFVEWNLREERLRIFLEREAKLSLIKEHSFRIHPASFKQCSHFIV